MKQFFFLNIMNTFDIIIAVLLLFGFIRGLFKGLFVEVASLAALIGGVYGAIHFSETVGTYLKTYVDWEENTRRLAPLPSPLLELWSSCPWPGKS